MMTPEREQARKLIAEVALNPKLAPPLLEILLAAGGDPEKLTRLKEKALREILDELPVEKTQKELFKTLYAGNYCTLGVRMGELGREVCLSIPKGSSISAARSEINNRLSLLDRCPQGFKIYPTAELDEEVLFDSEVVRVFTPVVDKSTNRVRSVSDASGDSNPKLSHEGLLTALKLDWVDDAYIRLAVGAFRVASGFPKTKTQIGNPSDPGDLLEGKTVRARTDSIVTLEHGITVSTCDDTRKRNNLGVSGQKLPG